MVRLHALKLRPEAFAHAMQRGLALAQLVGAGQLIEEMRAQPGQRSSDGNGAQTKIESMAACLLAERDDINFSAALFLAARPSRKGT